ncbi:MAG TPA: 50S ribosomal protein L25 [Thermomicrobiales bacterium]|nr:50S ribosomal protein L25 [Thermomicrobiales bacterium]
MADELILMAEPRTIHGKKVKRLRREGLVPGVVYGPVVNETVSVSVSSRVFSKFYMNHGHSTIFTLKWDGGSQPVLIREVQIDPVRRDIIHIDFFAPNMNVKLRQSVAVALHNVGDHEGVLQHVLNEVEVEALPADLPAELVVDASGLAAVGDAIHVRDLTAPQGVELVSDPDAVVASLVAEAAPTAEEEAEAAEAAEAAEEAPAEADAAESAEGED